MKNKENRDIKKKNEVFTPSELTYMSGAEHYKQDKKTGVWQPSDSAVEEMRDFSQENKL